MSPTPVSMNMACFTRLAVVGFFGFLVLGEAAHAAEVKVFSAHGMRPVVRQVAPKFESASGHKLSITYGELGALLKRIEAGETADVIIIPSEGIHRLIKDGKAAVGTEVVLARASIVAAVRTGTVKPDISSPEALKRTLLAAKSIAFDAAQGGGAAAMHLAQVFDRLDIASEMRLKWVSPTPGKSVAILVANGEAEIGMTAIQLLAPTPDVEVVGPLPGDLQGTLVFGAAVMNGSNEPTASRALIDFLRGSDAATVIRSYGMQPGTP